MGSEHTITLSSVSTAHVTLTLRTYTYCRIFLVFIVFFLLVPSVFSTAVHLCSYYFHGYPATAKFNTALSPKKHNPRVDRVRFILTGLHAKYRRARDDRSVAVEITSIRSRYACPFHPYLGPPSSAAAKIGIVREINLSL